MGLTKEQAEILLRLARATLEAYIRDGRTPSPSEEARLMSAHPGVFVTLRKVGELRGCVGLLSPKSALHKSVQEMTISAATGDPRFDPVGEDELADINIEISVLTPLRPIENVSEIEVGKHGLCVVKGHRRGVFLPDVAVEMGWDRTTFLRETCRKAGLPSDAWEDDSVELSVFESEKLSEG